MRKRMSKMKTSELPKFQYKRSPRKCLIASLIVIVSFIVISVLAIIGMILNIVKLVDCDFDDKTSYKTEIVRAISIPTGIGAITGFMSIGEDEE